MNPCGVVGVFCQYTCLAWWLNYFSSSFLYVFPLANLGYPRDLKATTPRKGEREGSLLLIRVSNNYLVWPLTSPRNL